MPWKRRRVERQMIREDVFMVEPCRIIRDKMIFPCFADADMEKLFWDTSGDVHMVECWEAS